EMLDPEDFRPQDTAKFAIGGAFTREDTPSTPEMLDPEEFRPQDTAKFAIGGAFKREETASTPEMLDPEEFRPQDTAKFAIGGAFRRDTTENDAPGMLSENEIRKSFESESRFDFNVGGNFASSSNAANTKRSFAEMFSPEELLASAENLKVPFDFTVYPAGHPGFAEEIDDTSVDEWYEDDADFLPPFRLEDDDDFSTDLNVSPPQAHPSQDIAQQISAAVEASLTSVLRKLMTEELLPVIERRIDEKFEALREQLAAQTLNIPKED
ncbi:MAG: hypothetical protein J6S69_00170, partial [Proteobacteria bacterium]|nr:hypothetical protein [Pseudomonadota bacterium]